jgi:hypothetical protein
MSLTRKQSEQLAKILRGLCRELKMKPGQLFDEIMERGRKAVRD